MAKSQSPLVGAFVPASQLFKTLVYGHSRNPLWSGHSFRRSFRIQQDRERLQSQSPLVGAFVPAYVVTV